MFIIIKTACVTVFQWSSDIINVQGKRGVSVELDPDKDFRPILKRQSTIEHERGALEHVFLDD